MTTRHPLHAYKFINAFPIFRRDAIRTKVPRDCAGASQKRGDRRQLGLRVAVVAFAFCACTPAVLAQPDTWTTRASMPTARPTLAAGVINGNLYAVGGFLDLTGKRTPAVEVYNPATDTWTTKAPMLTARDAAAAGVIDGKLYVAGGLDDSHNVSHLLEVYDPGTDTWTTARSMSPGLCYAAAGVIDGKLYVAGGPSETSGQSSVDTLEVYDPATDTWTTAASMSTARTTLAGAVVDDKLYAAGGVMSNSMGFSYVSTLEAYDPASNSWTTVASMPIARSSAAAAAIDGKLYVVGGGSNVGIFDTLEVYDPATDTWTTETPMPTARAALAATAIDGQLYAVGGVNASGDLSTLEVFGLLAGYTATVQPPINVDGSSVFNASRGAVLIKFILAFNGTSTCSLPQAQISVIRVSDSTNSPINESDFNMPSDSGSTFRITDCQYVYNLGTKSLGPGSYRVGISINNFLVGSGTFGLE
jgi:N-acetylneuraminic acid mutarotase